MSNVKLYERRSNATERKKDYPIIIKRICFYAEVNVDDRALQVRKILIPDFIQLSDELTQLRVYAKGYYLQLETNTETMRAKVELYACHSGKLISGHVRDKLIKRFADYAKEHCPRILAWLYELPKDDDLQTLETILRETVGIKQHRHIDPCVEVWYQGVVEERGAFKNRFGNVKRTTRVLCLDESYQLKPYYENAKGELIQIPEPGDTMLVVKIDTFAEPCQIPTRLESHLYQATFNVVNCFLGEFRIDVGQSGDSLLRAYAVFAAFIGDRPELLTWLLNPSHNNYPNWVNIDTVGSDLLAGRPFIIPAVKQSIYLPVSSGTRVILLDKDFNHINAVTDIVPSKEIVNGNIIYTVLVRQRNTFISANRAIALPNTTRVANVKRREYHDGTFTEVDMDLPHTLQIVKQVQTQYPSLWQYLDFEIDEINPV